MQGFRVSAWEGLMIAKNYLKVLVCLLCFEPNLLVAKIFRIAGITEAPLRYYDTQKTLKGIDIEIIEQIFKRLKIPFKVVLLESSPGLKKIYQEKSADMILSFSKTTEREQYLEYAQEPHMKIDWHFFTLKEQKSKYQFTKFSDLKGVSVGVTRGFAYTVDFWQAIESGTLKPVYEHRNGLQIEKLLNRKVDLVVLNRLVTMYQAKQGRFADKIHFLEKPVKSSLYYNSFVRSSNYPNIQKVKEAYDVVLSKLKTEKTYQEIIKRYNVD